MDPKHEKKIFVTHLNVRQSIFLMLLKLISLELIFVLMFLIFVTFLSTSSLSDQLKFSIISHIKFVFIPLALIKIFLTVYVVLLWLNEYYEIKTDMIVHKRGIIWRKEEHYPARQIREVKIHQGTLGRVFQFGTVTLFDWDLAKYKTLYLIHNPLKYARILETLLPKASQGKDVIREKIVEKEE